MIRLVLTTFGNAEDAAGVIRTLVEERLAACGTILPGSALDLCVAGKDRGHGRGLRDFEDDGGKLPCPAGTSQDAASVRDAGDYRARPDGGFGRLCPLGEREHTAMNKTFWLQRARREAWRLTLAGGCRSFCLG